MVRMEGPYNEKPELKVGDGVTETFHSDCPPSHWRGGTPRHAGTVVKVTPCTVSVQRDKSTLDIVKQEYTYEADPDGGVTIFRWLRKGKYESAFGSGLIGGRYEWYDPSFADSPGFYQFGEPDARPPANLRNETPLGEASPSGL
jgi:hypothetical protein